MFVLINHLEKLQKFVLIIGPVGWAFTIAMKFQRNLLVFTPEKSRNVNIVGNGGGDKGRSNERTYALGHTLINTNNGVLCNAASGLDGPNVLVMWSTTSSDMYNVVVKRASVKK